MFRFRSQILSAGVLIVAISVLVSRANLIAARESRPPAPPQSPVMTGVDVYEAMNSEPFAGKRVGLVTNQTGVDVQGFRTIDVLARRRDFKLVALFSPEHGIRGDVDDKVPSTTDATTGLPIYSLYGDTRRPTGEMLKGVDVLIFDIQDAGVRFFTYVTTMAYCMEEAAKGHISFVVFDRPDPLGGEVIEGPVLDRDRLSFTAYFPMPVRPGMTMGEFATMFNAENKIGADLRVIRLRGWHRRESYDQTGLKWIPPSPNLRTVNEAFLYPGIEILQAGGVSVGRGTPTPFEILGAPWIRAGTFTKALTSRKIPGASFAPARFVPRGGLYKGQACQGVTIRITDRGTFRSMRVGLEIAAVLHRLYPSEFDLDKINTLLGSQAALDRLWKGDPPADIVFGWATDIENFRKVRDKYLLYR